MAILTTVEKASYDTVVSNLNGNTVETSVPLSAVFTDTQVDVQAGANIAIDKTNPLAPIISASASGSVNSVVGGTNTTVDNTDPVNPIVNVPDMTYDDTTTVKSNISGEPAGAITQVLQEFICTRAYYDGLGAGRNSQYAYNIVG